MNNPFRKINVELPPTTSKWTPEDCLHKSKTNAFGKITFNIEQVGGKKPAKVIISYILELFVTRFVLFIILFIRYQIELVFTLFTDL